MKRVDAALDLLGDPMLESERYGRFCYITHAGAPLCRLTWSAADNHRWDFAIYKYSTSKYGPLDFALTIWGTSGGHDGSMARTD